MTRLCRIAIVCAAGFLAVAHVDLDQLGDAQRCIGEALDTIEKTKERWCEAEAYRLAGEIALMSPEPDAAKAEEYFERALAVSRQQQAKSWKLRASLGSQALPWINRFNCQSALLVIDRASAIYEVIEHPIGVHTAMGKWHKQMALHALVPPISTGLCYRVGRSCALSAMATATTA